MNFSWIFKIYVLLCKKTYWIPHLCSHEFHHLLLLLAFGIFPLPSTANSLCTSRPFGIRNTIDTMNNIWAIVKPPMKRHRCFETVKLPKEISFTSSYQKIYLIEKFCRNVLKCVKKFDLWINTFGGRGSRLIRFFARCVTNFCVRWIVVRCNSVEIARRM